MKKNLSFTLVCLYFLFSTHAQIGESDVYEFNMTKKEEHLPSSEIIEFNMIAPSTEFLLFYEGEINQELEQSKLFEPQGEFENKKMYQDRLTQAELFRKEIHKKYDEKYTNYIQAQATALRKKIQLSYQEVNIKIDQIDRYNPDLEFFQVKILGEWGMLKIPLSQAPSFKKNIEKVKVIGQSQLLGDGLTLDTFNIVIFHPEIKQQYQYGKHRAPLFMEEENIEVIENNSIEEGVPNLNAYVSFEEPSGNQLLDANEKASIIILITNEGKGTARNIHIKNLNIEKNPHLVVRRPEAIKEIPPGQKKIMKIGLEANEYIQTTDLLFNLSFSEERIYPPPSVNITIQVQGFKPPNISLSNVGIEEIQGNDINNIIENGEVIKVTAILENIGELVGNDIETQVIINNNEKNILILQTKEFPISQNIEELKPGDQYPIKFVFSPNYKFSSEKLPIHLKVKEKFSKVEKIIPLNLRMKEKLLATQDIEIKGVYGALGNRRDYALFFCVSEYKNDNLIDLDNPIINSEEIAKELREHYGFNTEVVKNPTIDQIWDKIEEYTNNFNNNTDNLYHASGQLLIYFTGHGEREYFLPSDANPSALYRTAFSYNDGRNSIDDINCHHILVAIDACYSGNFRPEKFKSGREWGRPDELSEKEKVLNDHIKYKTRRYLTSSKDEKTPDKSDFAKGILMALRQKKHKNGILRADQIYSNYLNNLRPKPLFDTFGKDEAGSSFLFIEK